MGTLNEDLSSIKTVEDTLNNNKVARFAYTEGAYSRNEADGVDDYVFSRDRNIPNGTPDIMKVNPTVLDKGYRAQASSLTRMLMNHFLGRVSYNLNKITDNMTNLINTLLSHLGTANGVATLDENGRIPYTQLPESALEYKGNWDASTNTPALANGTGIKGDFYLCTVGGTVDFGAGAIQFNANDRVLYDGSVWTKLGAGTVLTVNGKSPENGNVNLNANDVSAVPTSRTINNKALSSNITLSASDVGAELFFHNVALSFLSEGGPGNFGSITLNVYSKEDKRQIDTIAQLKNLISSFSGAFGSSLNCTGNVPIQTSSGVKQASAQTVEVENNKIKIHYLLQTATDGAFTRSVTVDETKQYDVYGTIHQII